MADNNLTISEVGQLHTILDAASRSARVRWLGEGSDYRVLEGTARHIVRGPEPSEWGFIGREMDVRDAFLRITSVTGMEYAVPVRYLMGLVAEGGFAVDS